MLLHTAKGLKGGSSNRIHGGSRKCIVNSSRIQDNNSSRTQDNNSSGAIHGMRMKQRDRKITLDRARNITRERGRLMENHLDLMTPSSRGNRTPHLVSTLNHHTNFTKTFIKTL